MPTQITINSISGVSPYDVYLCDNPITTCIWIDTIISSQLPYIFDVPSILESQTIFNLKVIDNNNCQVISYLDTISTTTPTPTPTGTNGAVTPTPTPTKTVTPTPTMTNTPTPTSTSVPVVECLGYSIVATSDGAEYSIEGCCGNLGSTSIIAGPYDTVPFCSISTPILISGGAVLNLSPPCQSCL